MWLLFELGILFSKIMVRRRATDDESPDDPEGTGKVVSAAHPGPKAPSGASGVNRTTPRSTAYAGAGAEVGRDLDPHFDDPDRWHPLSESEMEAELDLIEADEVLNAGRTVPPKPAVPAPTSQARATGSATTPAINSVEEKIRRANRLRELGSSFAARTVLYEVLEEGDDDQRRVARNILNQLDEA
jgi:sec-independent protein translocase protein TatC